MASWMNDFMEYLMQYGPLSAKPLDVHADLLVIHVYHDSSSALEAQPQLAFCLLKRKSNWHTELLKHVVRQVHLLDGNFVFCDPDQTSSVSKYTKVK